MEYYNDTLYSGWAWSPYQKRPDLRIDTISWAESRHLSVVIQGDISSRVNRTIVIIYSSIGNTYSRETTRYHDIEPPPRFHCNPTPIAGGWARGQKLISNEGVYVMKVMCLHARHFQLSIRWNCCSVFKYRKGWLCGTVLNFSLTEKETLKGGLRSSNVKSPRWAA
jgi:hypothetical protein